MTYVDDQLQNYLFSPPDHAKLILWRLLQYSRVTRKIILDCDKGAPPVIENIEYFDTLWQELHSSDSGRSG